MAFRYNNKLPRSICFVLLISFSLLHCTSPKQGCDDPNATNYAFDADEPCNAATKTADCPCVYPKLAFNCYAKYSVNVNGKDTLISWNTSLPLTNEQNQTYYLKNFAFYLSDIKLYKNNGEAYTVSDSTLIPIKYSGTDSTKIMLLNNIALIGEQTSAVSVGTLRENGYFNRMTFNVGLSNPYNHANIRNKDMPIHPLNIDSLYNDTKFSLYGAKIYVQPDTATKAFISITWAGTQQVSIDIPSTVIVKSGFDAAFNLYFDFSKLFYDVNFQNDNYDTIENKVALNFKKCFNIIK